MGYLALSASHAQYIFTVYNHGKLSAFRLYPGALRTTREYGEENILHIGSPVSLTKFNGSVGNQLFGIFDLH